MMLALDIINEIYIYWKKIERYELVYRFIFFIFNDVKFVFVSTTLLNE
jgi:hypothetical protein